MVCEVGWMSGLIGWWMSGLWGWLDECFVGFCG